MKRDFLATHGAAPSGGRAAARPRPTSDRLFPGLAPFRPPVRGVEAQRRWLQERAGTLRAREAAAASGWLENPAIPAGYTYLGQLVAHDLSFTGRSVVGGRRRASGPDSPPTPALDLDVVYAGGPRRSPELYAPVEGAPEDALPLRLATRGLREDGREARRDDLPRDADGRALVADPRNDQNVLIAQLTLAIHRFHNAALRHACEERGLAGEAAFEAARTATRWHLQWVILHDYLPRLVGARALDRVWPRDASGLRAGRPRLEHYPSDADAFVPAEFAAAAFRAGHSMVRARYTVNDRTGSLPLFVADGSPARADDLRGERPIPAALCVQWDRFVPIDGSRPQGSLRLDAALGAPMHVATAEQDGYGVAELDLLRGLAEALPSGQSVASALGIPPVTRVEEPLSSYVLLEAEGDDYGRRLGPVGATIVVETLLGVLLRDSTSYLARDPDWTPELGDRGRAFDLAELLRVAGVPRTADELFA